jgi:hypothetical protein
MLVRIRNRTAGALAVIGGVLIFIGGTTGMAVLLTELNNIIQDWLGEPNTMIETVFLILIFIAALGGITVMIGGYLIYKNRVIIGKFLIMLGCSMGFFGLIIGLITALIQGEGNEFFSWVTTSFTGVGFILAIIANFLAKRPGVV